MVNWPNVQLISSYACKRIHIVNPVIRYERDQMIGTAGATRQNLQVVMARIVIHLLVVAALIFVHITYLASDTPELFSGTVPCPSP